MCFVLVGKPMKLTPETEEVATFYGRMLDHDYTTKEVFNKNFFKDWRKVITPPAILLLCVCFGSVL